MTENITAAVLLVTLLVNFIILSVHLSSIEIEKTEIPNLLNSQYESENEPLCKTCPYNKKLDAGGDENTDEFTDENADENADEFADEFTDDNYPIHNSDNNKEPMQNLDIKYGEGWQKYQSKNWSYMDAYRDPAPIVVNNASENTQGVDGAMALLIRRRNRDKRVIDGVVSKTADYYKYHFADELERREAADWWGESE